MKYKYIFFTILGMLLAPTLASATPVSVPSAPGSGYFLVSTTTGAYIATSTPTFSTICFVADTCRTTWPSSGSSWPFTASTYGPTNVSATSTPLKVTSTSLGFIASSTSWLDNVRMLNSTTTYATTTNLAVTGTASTTNLIVSGQSGCATFTTGILTGSGVACGTGGAGVWPFVTTNTNYNVPVQSTTTPEWFKGSPYSLFASSTAVFVNASSTQFTIQGWYISTSTTVCIRGETCPYPATPATADTAFQSAINAVVAAGGGTVYVKPGAYTFTAQANIGTASKVSIVGGPGTTIYAPSTANGNLSNAFLISTSTDITIQGLTIDGTNQNTGAFNDNVGIHILNSSRIKIINNTFYNMYGFGIYSRATSGATTSDVLISGNHMYCLGRQDCIGGGPDQSQTEVSTTTDFLVTNNIIHQTTYAGGVENTNMDINCFDMVAVVNIDVSSNECHGNIVFGVEQHPNWSSKITNNIVDGPDGSLRVNGDIAVRGDNTTATESEGNLLISGNIVKNGKITVNGGGSSQLIGVVISNNIVTTATSSSQNYNSPDAVQNGINLLNAKNSSITGNNVTAFSTVSTTTGIKVTTATSITISNNTITNFAGSGAVGLDGGSGSGVTSILNTYINNATNEQNTTNSLLFTSGNFGIGTTTPGSVFSLGSIANFTTATSSLYGSGGINLKGGCFAINGTCVGGTSAATGVWPFTTTNTNYGVAVQSTTTPEWFKNGLMASSTSYVDTLVASTTITNNSLFGEAGYTVTISTAATTSLTMTPTQFCNLTAALVPVANTTSPSLILPPDAAVSPICGSLIGGEWGWAVIENNSSFPLNLATTTGSNMTFHSAYPPNIPATTTSIIFFEQTTLNTAQAMKLDWNSQGLATSTIGGYFYPTNGGTGSSTLSSTLLLGNGTAPINSYTGTSCTNQFVRSINGAGVATCATVANTDLANSSINHTYQGNVAGGASVALGGTLIINGSTTPSFSTFYATTTNATSTILGGLSVGQLNVSSTTASSTAASGFDISGGCFAINHVCVGGSSSSGANPTASLGLSAINGSASTFMRSDGAPALSQSIAPTMTGLWAFSNSGTTTHSGGLYAALIAAPYFIATSTTATSTFSAPINIATTSQSALIINDGFSTSHFIFNTASSTNNEPRLKILATTTADILFQIDQYGHLTASSTPKAISLSSCGTSPTFGANANDVTGKITVGTGAVTACTITFGAAYSAAPIVMLTNGWAAATTTGITAVSTTAFTVSSSVSMGGASFYYHVLMP